MPFVIASSGGNDNRRRLPAARLGELGVAPPAVVLRAASCCSRNLRLLARCARGWAVQGVLDGESA
eukprot:832845-Pyramimonas_sp.AAC.1